MRKPRDYDSELQVRSHKAKQVKDRKLRQLGKMVIATDTDALPVEQLAGALLSAIDTKDAITREGWRKRGATFFQAARNTRGDTEPNHSRADARGHDAQSLATGSGA